MKGLISIFTLPHEIDMLHTTLYNLRRNSVHLRETDIFGFDITLCLSDELTDWNKSLSKSYFEDKFFEMTNALCDWAIPQNINIEYGTDILGCVSQRRHSLKYTKQYDFTVWLDNDLMFNDYLLSYISLSAETIHKNTEYYIITPQITRQWDTSWDVLVNSKLLNEPFYANRTADVFNLTLSNTEDVSLKKIDTFKFAGGWGTVISNGLLDTVGIPASLGHYGLEDTYVMQCSHMLRNVGYNVAQFVIDNMLACENHRYAHNRYLSSNVSSIYRKEEYLATANKNFRNELKIFNDRISV